MKKNLVDVQGSPDSRGITIQRVGVKEVHLPLEILCKDASYQHVLANISLCADLSHKYRGTHMSRFMEILTEYRKKKFSSLQIQQVLSDVTKKLSAKNAQISVKFKYFVQKKAPVSRLKSILDYDCMFYGILEKDLFSFILGVKVPVQLVCPCSKEISLEGAHNQRAIVKVNLECKPDNLIWIEDLVSLVESKASSGVYPLIKREDEKYITEHSYDNAKFVEDVTRDLVDFFRKDKKIRWFEVECDSYESIHNHNAFAFHEELLEPDSEEGLLPVPDMYF
ncbi:MAG: GTP cyclohydrolase FolE2 [Vulcanimicrobiota bacterium]